MPDNENPILNQSPSQLQPSFEILTQNNIEIFQKR